MNIYDAFLQYIEAEQNFLFAILSVTAVMALVAVITLFVKRTTFAKWFSVSLLVLSLTLVVGMIFDSSRPERIKTQSTEIFQQGERSFVEYEIERVGTDLTNFATYHLYFWALVALAVVLLIFVRSPKVKGLSLMVIVLFTTLILTEKIVFIPFHEYLEILKNYTP